MSRTLLLYAIALTLAASAAASERVSVAQLENILANATSKPDSQVATRLSGLQLTERFSSARLDHWEATLPGIRSQRALMGLADRSAFLSPPADEIPMASAPDFGEQRRIMGLTATYVSRMIPQLPRFYASRTVTHFEDSPEAARTGSWNETDSLHPARISRSVVSYHDGSEVIEPGAFKVKDSPTVETGLRTWGTFGPILGLVLLDAAQNKLQWGRWERDSDGVVAVFSYSVPRDKSHYEVNYCCVVSAFGMETKPFAEMSAYHGEITVDPATGAVRRLTIESELDASDPISQAAVEVEYSPVELGGASYICPRRSVSISLAQTLKSAPDAGAGSLLTMGPPQLLLNDVAFSEYHLFHADSHILTPEEERAAGTAPDVTLAKSEQPEALPAEEDIQDMPLAKPNNVSSAAGANGTGESQANPSEGQEITTSAATGLPNIPVHQTQERSTEAQSSGLTLRVNTRLVDVNVVALDKKGRPIPNLKPEDFEVYDNGVKQTLQSFLRTSAEAAPAVQPAPSAASSGFSNQVPQSAKATNAEETSLVLLIDAGNLDFGDLTDARQQMEHFLRSLPASESVALYWMKDHSFQVLHETSTDHAALAEQLAHWNPTAAVANAQDEEMRNRQQIETVLNPEDQLSVNGNYTLDSEAQSEALDPKLREMGSTPGPNALNILVNVAHHLSAIPGHKNLVWITSDNALADWDKQSFNIDKGAKFVEPIALRAQEALNKAHVSIYPLDASRLEASVVQADIGRRNVELTPTYQRPPEYEHEIEGPEMNAGQDANPLIQNRNFGNGSRLYAEMEQDTHAIQGVFREVADATGGRTFRRSSNIGSELNSVVADGHATYLLGFSPDQPADGKYHLLKVTLAGHPDVTLRFRSGYQYDEEPTTLKQRFAQAVWQPTDSGEIALSAKPVTDAQGDALRITVSGADLALTQQDSLWTGKFDIFLVQRDQEALHAKVTGLTVGLRLKPATYEHAIKDGLTFDERLGLDQKNGSWRVVVVDANTGRIGSVTVPSAALEAKR
ncbi:MAG TPA: VWA domain-containing protein [Terracidiphilus sp.]|nr:VWA domain-containing protein [Terracidiphilus sp.]